MAVRDPDDLLVALFKHHAQKNVAKSLEAGREIFDDEEVCEIRKPGSKDYSVHPATAMSHWNEDRFTGEMTKVTYAERFYRQYQQFKQQALQTKSGTPLASVPFLTEARRAELRAQNLYTVEALAAIDGPELKNLGPNGRSFKNSAIDYIAESRASAPDLQMRARLEAAEARNAILEEDLARAKNTRPVSGSSVSQENTTSPLDGQFADMSTEQLRDYITTNKGQAPLGSMNRKTLIRLAQEAQTENA